jgi:hypothetical protein
MSQQSSYSKEEIEMFEKYLIANPNKECWTTLDGVRIPYKFIKDDHLQNIIKHLKDRVEYAKKDGVEQWRYEKLLDSIEVFENLLRKRLIKSTLAGKVLFANK